MRTKTLAFLLFSFVFHFLFFLPEAGVSQSEAQSQELMVLQHVKYQSSKTFVGKGKTIIIKTTEGERLKGIYNGIGPNGVMIDSLTIPLDQIDVLKVKGLGKEAARVSGWVLFLIGLGGGLLGLLLSISGIKAFSKTQFNSQASNGCGAMIGIFFWILGAVILAALGFTIMMVGMISLLVGYIGAKPFKMRKKWRFKIGE